MYTEKNKCHERQVSIFVFSSMSLTLLHGSEDEIHCEIHHGALNTVILSEIVDLSGQLFSLAPNLNYVQNLNKRVSALTLIARNNADNIIGYKLGYAISHDVFYSWLGGIHPAYRNRGIASLLIQTQHDWCIKNGFRLIRTKTLQSNAIMYALNRKHGFHVIGNDCTSSLGTKLLYSKHLISIYTP